MYWNHRESESPGNLRQLTDESSNLVRQASPALSGYNWLHGGLVYRGAVAALRFVRLNDYKMRRQLLLQLSTVEEELNAARAKATELEIAMQSFFDRSWALMTTSSLCDPHSQRFTRAMTGVHRASSPRDRCDSHSLGHALWWECTERADPGPMLSLVPKCGCFALHPGRPMRPPLESRSGMRPLVRMAPKPSIPPEQADLRGVGPGARWG